MIWAFARDRGLPLYWIWAKLDRRTHTPILTVWLAGTIPFLLGLPILKSAPPLATLSCAEQKGCCSDYEAAFLGGAQLLALPCHPMRSSRLLPPALSCPCSITSAGPWLHCAWACSPWLLCRFCRLLSRGLHCCHRPVRPTGWLQYMGSMQSTTLIGCCCAAAAIPLCTAAAPASRACCQEEL